MPASMTANSDAAVRGFRSSTRATSAPAGPMIDRPGSTTMGSAWCEWRRRMPSRNRANDGTGPPSYEIPRPPPASTYSSAMPACCASCASSASFSAAPRIGSMLVICEPTWTCSATSRDRTLRPERRQQHPDVVGRNAELVDLQAGGNVRMAFRVDVGVHANGDARDAAHSRGNGFDARELARRLDVDRFEIERDGALELRVGLADAVEHDLPRARSRRARATSTSHMDTASTQLPSAFSSATSARVEFALKA